MSHSSIYAFSDRSSFDDFYGKLLPSIKRDTKTVYVSRRIGTSLLNSPDFIEDIDDMRAIRVAIVPIHHSFQYGELLNKDDLQHSFPNIDNDVLDRIWNEKITYKDCFAALHILTKKYGRVALQNLANFKFDASEFPSLQDVVGGNGDRWIVKEMSLLQLNDNDHDNDMDNNKYYDDDDDLVKDNSDSYYGDDCSDRSDYDDFDNNKENPDHIDYKILPLDGRKSYLDVLLTATIDDDNTLTTIKTTPQPKHEWRPIIEVKQTTYKRKDRLYYEDAKLNHVDYDDDDDGIMDVIYSELSMKGLRVKNRLGSSLLTLSQQIAKNNHIANKK